MGILYIVATPIGNLEDITLRALRILKEVDLVACEDTRQTRKLLDHYDIKTGTVSYHQHSRVQKIDWLVEQLQAGKNIALVSDAGTPGISDPGFKLVEAAQQADIKVETIPGPSAVIAAASVAGLPVDKFVFLGFPPHKKGRETFFKNLINEDKTIIFYESPHR
ncbi:MAG: 16S rRNA (cytidine(1402)-2'-O)-methyltransferase, partial [bacterium]